MDIESCLIAWINEQSLGIEAFPSKPGDGTKRCVTVERTGGDDDGIIDHPTVAVQCWGDTMSDAKNIAYALKRTMLDGFADGRSVISCSCNSCGRFPSDKGEPRYQVVFDIDAYCG